MIMTMMMSAWIMINDKSYGDDVDDDDDDAAAAAADDDDGGGGGSGGGGGDGDDDDDDDDDDGVIGIVYSHYPHNNVKGMISYKLQNVFHHGLQVNTQIAHFLLMTEPRNPCVDGISFVVGWPMVVEEVHVDSCTIFLYRYY